MKRESKKVMLVFLNPEIKEMLRYQAYRKNKSQNTLIEEILRLQLEKELDTDKHFKELANIK